MKNKIISVIALILLCAQSAVQASGRLATINGDSGTYQIHVLASSAPLTYVSGGVVTVVDSAGAVVARGKTNVAGAFSAPLSPDKFANLPLKITISGGRLVDGLGDDTGKFRGHLRANVVSLPDRAITSIHLDLVSTAASKLASHALSYGDAIKKVKRTLGIYDSAPDFFLSYLNGAVGISNLKEKVSRSNGFDLFVNKISRLASRNRNISGLVPSGREIQKYQALLQAKATGKTILAAPRAHSMAPKESTSSGADSPPVCRIPIPNGSESSTSSQIISDFGVLVALDLLDYAGAPGSVAGGLAGMLLTGGLAGLEPSKNDVNMVAAQLSCIMSQIGAVSGKLDTIATQQQIQTAEDCETTLDDNIVLYRNLVVDHVTAICPTTSTGTCISGDTCVCSSADLTAPSDINTDKNLPKYLAAWGPEGAVVRDCKHGKVINNMLFGNGSGGLTGAWPLINQEYQNKYRWYTQKESQTLQGFLDHWGELVYEDFLLTNEYDNYVDDYKTASLYSGGVPGSPGKCVDGTEWTTTSYCAVVSNINNAYPGHLYSDEIGIWDNGFSVNPYPAGLSIGLSQIGLDTVYILLHLDGNDQYYAKESYGNAYNDFNHKYALELDSNSTPEYTAIETFDKPRAARTIKLVESDAKVLQLDQQPNGLRVADFFVKAINSSAISEWKKLTGKRGSTAFWTYDDYARETSCDGDGCVVSLGALVNNDNPDAQCNPFGHTRAACYDVFRPPVMGVILARDWWEGASGASSYVPPKPCADNYPEGCVPNR